MSFILAEIQVKPHDILDNYYWLRLNFYFVKSEIVSKFKFFRVPKITKIRIFDEGIVVKNTLNNYDINLDFLKEFIPKKVINKVINKVYTKSSKKCFISSKGIYILETNFDYYFRNEYIGTNGIEIITYQDFSKIISFLIEDTYTIFNHIKKTLKGITKEIYKCKLINTCQYEEIIGKIEDLKLKMSLKPIELDIV